MMRIFPLAFIYTYDVNGNIDTKSNGVLLGYDYNEIDQLKEQAVVIEGFDLRMRYSYSPTGAVNTITDQMCSKKLKSAGLALSSRWASIF